MYAARIVFETQGGATEEAVEGIYGLLAIWFKNGQLMGGYPVARTESAVVVFATIPALDALEAGSSNEYGASCLASLKALSVSQPDVTILGVEPGQEETSCICSSHEWLYIYTNYLSEFPPIWCGVCGGYVPLYRLPHVEGGEQLLWLQWQQDYKACDTLQMHCTTGERFGERQLQDVNSSLSKNGRNLASILEKQCGIPVYYYLCRLRGRSLKSELDRRCPSCKSEWRWMNELLELFHFRCVDCRLLSNRAFNLVWTDS